MPFSIRAYSLAQASKVTHYSKVATPVPGAKGTSGEKQGRERDGRAGEGNGEDLGGGEGDKLDDSLVRADEMPLEESEAFPDANNRVWGWRWDAMSSECWSMAS